MVENNNLELELLELRIIKILFDLHNLMVDNNIQSTVINMKELEDSIKYPENEMPIKSLIMAIARKKFMLKLKPINNYKHSPFQFEVDFIN